MTTYDILQNHSNYPTVCLLLDTAHWTQEKHNYLDTHSNAFTCLGKYNKKKERVPDGPTINFHKASKIHVLYHPWHWYCIIWEMNLR